jgi:predicted porin
VIKKLVAISAILGTSGLAFAQGNVTLYGTLDVGVTYLNSQVAPNPAGDRAGGQNISVTSGNSSPSIFGLKGEEDIGGGTKAIFRLENSFNVQNGTLLQAGTLFNHETFVGLSSSDYGKLTLGRQYDPYTIYLGLLAASNNGASLSGAHFGDVDNLAFSFSIPNSVKYETPNWGGFKAGALYSLGGEPGAFSQNRAWSLGASYNTGALSLAAGFMNVNHPFQSVLGGAADGTDYTYIGSLSYGPAAYDALQNADSLKVFGVGGSYGIGKATIGLIYTHTLLQKSLYFAQVPGGSASDVVFDTGEINGTYNFSPELIAGAEYIYTAGHVASTGQRPTFQTAGVNLTYLLSKRTAIYGIANFQHAGGDGIGIFTNSVTGATTSELALAQLPVSGTSNSSNQVAVSVGIRHNF